VKVLDGLSRIIAGALYAYLWVYVLVIAYFAYHQDDLMQGTLGPVGRLIIRYIQNGYPPETIPCP